MFNWQASGTEPVLSSRFWIYWAVTLPLTLLVLSVWLSWLHQHKSHEPKTLQNVLKSQTRPEARRHSNIWHQLKSSRLRSQMKAEDDEADAEADGQIPPSAEAGNSKFARPVRAETLMQGPRR